MNLLTIRGQEEMMRRLPFHIVFVLTAVFVCPLSLRAAQVVISKASTASPGVLNGVTFYDSDLVSLDPTNPNGTASMYATNVFDGRNLDAVYIRNDGKLIGSLDGSAYTSGGVTIYQGDLALYDPGTGTQGLYLNGNTATGRTDAFGNITSIFKNGSGVAVSENIDGVCVLSNGHILLSINSTGTGYLDQTGGGLLAFKNEDIVEYDPVAKTATMFFDGYVAGGGGYFASDENIKDFALLSSTQMIFTAASNFTVGGNTYQNNDIVLVDLNTKAMSMYMSHTLLPATPVYGIDGLSLVPEPATLLLLGLGGVLLRRRAA